MKQISNILMKSKSNKIKQEKAMAYDYKKEKEMF